MWGMQLDAGVRAQHLYYTTDLSIQFLDVGSLDAF